MKVIQCEQGDAVWHATRAGRITASRVKDALAFGVKGDPLKPRKDYMMQLLCENLTSLTSRHYVSPEMERGSEEEKFSRTAYEIRNGVDVSLAGIAIHREFDWLAASPDGLLGVTGGVEFKNPTTLTHLNWMIEGVLPKEHALQCHTIIDVWELDFLDFFSYDSRLPAHLAEFQAPRLWRDDAIIANIHEGLRIFHQELMDMIGNLNERFPAPPIEEIAAEDFGEEGITEEDLKYLDAMPAGAQEGGE